MCQHPRRRACAVRSSSAVRVLLISLAISAAVPQAHATAPYTSFTPPPPQSGAPPYTQELWAVSCQSNAAFGGIAFDPASGDLLVASCGGGPNPLSRYAAKSTVAASQMSQCPGTFTHAQMVHKLVTTYAPSFQGTSVVPCGLVSHSNGSLYAGGDNSSPYQGIFKMDYYGNVLAAHTSAGTNPWYGIAQDPITNNLVYADSNGRLRYINENLTGADKPYCSTPNCPNGSYECDGIYFTPDKKYLFCADPFGTPHLYIFEHYGPTGDLIQTIDPIDNTTAPNLRKPDGVAFHQNPPFVLTNDNTGTLTMYDFGVVPDYTSAPVISTFAKGGFRGDLTAVGPDKCFYVTQTIGNSFLRGTRFDPGALSDEYVQPSIVKICPDFIENPRKWKLTKKQTNNTGVTANDLDVVLRGTYTIQDHFDGINPYKFPSFSSSTAGGLTFLHWSGTNVPDGQSATISFTVVANDLPQIQSVSWTFNGTSIGCITQVNVDVLWESLREGDEVRYKNTLSPPCGTGELWIGNASVEWHRGAIDPSNLDPGGVRAAIRTDPLNLLAHLSPGQELQIDIRKPPEGAKYGLLTFQVGQDSSLGGPEVVTDFIEMEAIGAGTGARNIPALSTGALAALALIVAAAGLLLVRRRRVRGDPALRS